MAYCPDCLTEYVEGTRQCQDCGAQLIPGSPPETPPQFPSDRPDHSKLVPVRVFTGPTAVLDAEVARNILETQGIPSLVPGQTSLELLPVLDVSLLVREDDAERAAALLRDYLDTEAANPNE
jgi:Putative prokaryotic signal transducing protein